MNYKDRLRCNECELNIVLSILLLGVSIFTLVEYIIIAPLYYSMTFIEHKLKYNK